VAQQRSIEVRVGIFVAICLVILVGLIWKFGKYEPITRNTYELTVVFPNVGGIVKDASVLYGGIVVGRVRDIRLDQAGVLKVDVKLAIYNDVKIRKDSKFVINQSGLLGDRYVDVIPQGGTAEFLKPGTVVQGMSSVDLSEAIRGVVDVLHQAASTIERVDKAVQRIDETVLSRETLDHASASLANIDAATSNSAALTLSLRNVVEDNRGRIENTLAKFSDTAESFNQTSKGVEDLVAANRGDIRATTKNLAQSTERLNEILARLERGEGTAGKLLVDPTLHDEIVRLVQNWRRYGLLYKEGGKASTKRSEDGPRGTAPQPARPAQGGEGALIFGTDATKSAK
jgi:phospholipid/cholesterol/gamma-HCH transport system substrate-binding protein